MMNVILMIVLGSANTNFLQDRLDTAINFANNYAFNNTEIFSPEYNSIHWVLTGGIKNPEINTVSEAEIMAGYVAHRETPMTNWEYYLDEVSTNTAENFVMIKNHLNYSVIDYSDVYVVTSGFHYERAKKFSDIIIPNNNFNWILGTIKENNSDYWERIHMKNIQNDIIEIFKKYKLKF